MIACAHLLPCSLRVSIEEAEEADLDHESSDCGAADDWEDEGHDGLRESDTPSKLDSDLAAITRHHRFAGRHDFGTFRYATLS